MIIQISELLYSLLLAPESKTGKTKNVNKDKKNIKRIIILYTKIWVDIFIPTQI